MLIFIPLGNNAVTIGLNFLLPSTSAIVHFFPCCIIVLNFHRHLLFLNIQ